MLKFRFDRRMTDCKTTIRGGKVIDKLKHTSHHFVELINAIGNPLTKKIKGLIANFYLSFHLGKLFFSLSIF